MGSLLVSLTYMLCSVEVHAWLGDHRSLMLSQEVQTAEGAGICIPGRKRLAPMTTAGHQHVS